MARERNRWGWGFADAVIGDEQARAAAAGLRPLLGFDSDGLAQPVGAEALALPAPRVAAPPALAAICSAEDGDRAAHSLGKSYLDVVRALRGRYEHVVDLVARPREETEVDAVLAWAAAANRACPGASTGRSRSTSARWTACSRSTPCRARRASAPARAGRAS